MSAIDRALELMEVATAYIEINPERTVLYDGTECDGYCLIEDLRIAMDDLRASLPTDVRP